MPEGDTIHRTASALARAIEGESVTWFEAPRRSSVPGSSSGGARGRTIEPGERVIAVSARGKHLLIRCSGGLTLHTHMRMSGSWHLYGPGERWRAPRSSLAAAIGTLDVDAVCFSAPIVELLGDRELERHPVLGSLGPDLCDEHPDLPEVLRRVEEYDAEAEIGVLLLDQRVASGVGNVYRAEVAWACRLDPFRRLGSVDADTVRELFATASRLLRANLETQRRTTVPGGLAVYDRAGRPCPRCARPIETRRQGAEARSVWWCPGCQH